MKVTFMGGVKERTFDFKGKPTVVTEFDAMVEGVDEVVTCSIWGKACAEAVKAKFKMQEAFEAKTEFKREYEGRKTYAVTIPGINDQQGGGGGWRGAPSEPRVEVDLETYISLQVDIYGRTLRKLLDLRATDARFAEELAAPVLAAEAGTFSRQCLMDAHLRIRPKKEAS